jgi:tRNA (cmo5U34)-methyltransferase
MSKRASARPRREWESSDHAAAYLERADRVPHREAGEATLLDELPDTVRRVLDVGSGDGRLLALVLNARPGAEGIALDFSPHMLEQLRVRFASNRSVRVVAHDLDRRLPALGTFDVVVSSFAIHHLTDERKRALYREIWDVLEPGGVFCNLEHVLPLSARAHAKFLEAMSISPEDEDPSNILLDVRTQLDWLRQIGFHGVDCHWKWRELALLAGTKLLSTADTKA